MSHGKRNDILVMYDITDAKRLNRIHRCMCAWGMSLQYSVFYCQLTEPDRRHMEAALRKLIDPRADDIRVYCIRPLNEIQFLGRKPLPDGLTVLTDGVAL